MNKIKTYRILQIATVAAAAAVVAAVSVAVAAAVVVVAAVLAGAVSAGVAVLIGALCEIFILAFLESKIIGIKMKEVKIKC